MNKLFAAIFAVLLTAGSQAADRYTIDPTHTWPMFEVNHLGFSTQRGRFDRTRGQITLDTAARTGSVDIVIETGSISMGFAEWDRHVKEGYLNSVIFPTMRFTSDRFTFEGGIPVAATGELTLLGVTRPLTLKISDFACGPHPMLRKAMCGANVSATIRRSDFGMNKFLNMIGDEVRIYSPVEAFKD